MNARQPVASTLAEAVEQALTNFGGVQRKPAIAAWISERYPQRWRDDSLTTALYSFCVNSPNAIRNHPNSPRFLFYHGHTTYELYNSGRHGFFDSQGYVEGEAPVETTTEEALAKFSEALTASSEFATEAHLRDYLVRNLHVLEAGLLPWTGSFESSLEYVVGRKRIDILAKDASGTPVIIELKLSKGHESGLGQALYYRGKLKQLLGTNRVRIILVAGDITEELHVGSLELTDLDIYTYSLSMQVQRH